MRLEGKTAIITGAGSGQGRAAAILFAREGANVVVADVNVSGGEGTVAEIKQAGGQATFLRTDVSDEEQCEAMVEHAVGTYGQLNILYNNAGVWYVAHHGYVVGETDAPAPLLTQNIWDRTIDINLKGTYLCCKYGIPAMQKAEGIGAIINVSSVGAIRVGRGASDEKVDHWLRQAAGVEGFIGFAIGRSIWWDALKTYLGGEGEGDRAGAAKTISENYRQMIDVYSSAS